MRIAYMVCSGDGESGLENLDVYSVALTREAAERGVREQAEKCLKGCRQLYFKHTTLSFELCGEGLNMEVRVTGSENRCIRFNAVERPLVE